VKRKYGLVATGGTFDKLHRGHKILLRRAFAVGDRVIIGVSSDDFVKALRKPHRIDPYSKRRRALIFFLRKLGVLSRSTILPLHDRYGPTVQDPRIEAIVVSKETFPIARIINSLRRRKRLRPLAIVLVDTATGEDSKPISTTRIRRGIIDREGYLVTPY